MNRVEFVWKKIDQGESSFKNYFVLSEFFIILKFNTNFFKGDYMLRENKILS